jgi:hypothetical protein
MPAVTSVTNFSDGNVLTATALNAVNCGIHVYADAAARDAAYGGTGERTLVEGEYAYLLDTDQTLVYSGSSWVTVGVTPGLVCVKAETAFSAVSNFTADGVFTSSYTNYKIIVSVAQTADVFVTAVFRASGSDATSNYAFQRSLIDNTNLNAARSTSQSSIGIIYPNGGSGVCSANIEIYGPQKTANTNYTAYNNIDYTGTNTPTHTVSGTHYSASAYDGIKFAVASGTMTGTYTIYAYSKTV